MFSMSIHENVDAVILLNPSCEMASFPAFPSNQGLFKRINNVAPEFDGAALSQGGVATGGVKAVQTGAGSVPGLLEEAYINYHGVIPHHDFRLASSNRPRVKKASAPAHSWISPSGPCVPRQPITSILAPRRMAPGGRGVFNTG